MIVIKKSETADTRTCDWSKVTENTLLRSSKQHIGDIKKGLDFFRDKLEEAARTHDFDKITKLKWFHEDFKTGFKQTSWWDNHRKVNRHHIDKPDGVPKDVNLVDVIEHITDCVMAGMARSGSVYKLDLPNELLQRAFKNTTELLKANIKVDDSKNAL